MYKQRNLEKNLNIEATWLQQGDRKKREKV